MALWSKDLGIEFTASHPLGDGYRLAVGWCYDLRWASRAAMGIRYRKAAPSSRQNGAWVRRNPPFLSFEVGHIFYDHPLPREGLWPQTWYLLTSIVQVETATPDTLDGSEFRSGQVTFDVTPVKDAEKVGADAVRHVMSQADFVEFLRLGKSAAKKPASEQI